MSNTLLDDILEVGKEGTYEVLWVYDNENDLLNLKGLKMTPDYNDLTFIQRANFCPMFPCLPIFDELSTEQTSGWAIFSTPYRIFCIFCSSVKNA